MTLLTPGQIADRYPFTVHQIKHLLRNRENNGLSDCGCVLIVSKRILIVEDKFMNWLSNQVG